MESFLVGDTVAIEEKQEDIKQAAIARMQTQRHHFLEEKREQLDKKNELTE